MKTIAEQREYIADYVKNRPPYEIGYRLLKEKFGIPFDHTEDDCYLVNGVYMSEVELVEYVKEFFEGLDTRAIIELYNLIKA